MAKSDTKTCSDRMVRIQFTDCRNRNLESIPPKNGSAKTGLHFSPLFLPRIIGLDWLVIGENENREEAPAANPLPHNTIV
jgi:hypothetical protein